MTSKKFFDRDADLAQLGEKTLAVVGYGNQGRSQALNLRDSGLSVVVGSGRRDDSETRARDDSFEVLSLSESAKRADRTQMRRPQYVHSTKETL